MDDLTPADLWNLWGALCAWISSYCAAYLLYYSGVAGALPQFPASFSSVVRRGSAKHAFFSLKLIGWLLFFDLVRRRGSWPTIFITLKACCTECVLFGALNDVEMSGPSRKAHKFCALLFIVDHCIFCELVCEERAFKRVQYAACLLMVGTMVIRRKLMIRAGVVDVAGLDEQTARLRLSSLRPDFIGPLWYVELAFMGGQILCFFAGWLALASHLLK